MRRVMGGVLGVVLGWGLWVAPVGAGAAEPHGAGPAVAVFGFTMDNTSPAPTTAVEDARLARLGEAFSAALQQSGRYRPLVVTPQQRGAGADDIRGCNGCERDIAGRLHAPLAAYGWVQKVSNLILNLNVVIEDVRTGRTVAGGSVDIRGNTDESWNRGLSFLLEEHVFDH